MEEKKSNLWKERECLLLQVNAQAVLVIKNANLLLREKKKKQTRKHEWTKRILTQVEERDEEKKAEIWNKIGE